LLNFIWGEIVRDYLRKQSKLLRKSVYKPSKFLTNLLISRSLKRNEEAYKDIQAKNIEFYNQGNVRLCELDNQYCQCSCEECRK